MKDRYYDLVIELIQKNRKYQGLESILNDIAEDVLERAKTVLLGVDNEEVIEAYLNKIVTSSIITTSKRLNVYPNSNRTQSFDINSIINKNETLDRLDEEFEDSDVEEDFADASDDEIIDSKEEFEDFEEISDDIIENFDLESDMESYEIEGSSINDDFEETADAIERDDAVEEDDAVLDDEIFELNDEIESTSETIIEEVSVDDELSDMPEEINDLTEIEQFQDEEIKSDDELEENILELDSSDNVDVNLVDQMINGVAKDELEDLTPNNEDLLENEIEDLDNSLIEEIEDVVLEEEEIAENFSLDEIEETSMVEEVIEEINDVDGKDEEEVCSTIDYSVFNYEPNIEEFDIDYVKKSLKDYIRKNGDEIIEISNLKYSENMSIEEIAKILAKDESYVLDILNDFIEIMKD